MNQAIKDNVYKLGNNDHVNFMAFVSGMDDEESQVLMMLHQGCSDITIQNDMGLTRKSYDRIERTVRVKLALGMFQLINDAMDRAHFKSN